MVKPSFPKAYLDTVPMEGADPIMVYTKLKDMDIGARPSTLGKISASEGPRSIEHVGQSAGKKGGR